MQTDLFGDAERVKIGGNPLLEQYANHILDLVKRQPWLLDGTVGEVDRKLWISVALDNGLRGIIKDDELRSKVTGFLQSKACPDEEAISRARRYLAEHDKIRLSQAAVVAAEGHRQRIAHSFNTNRR